MDTQTSTSSPVIHSRRYLVVTPCRDEEEFIQITIDTMAAQSVTPSCWVIVDDGSTDRTPEILAEASKLYPWIKVVQRADRGERAVGPGVIQAFNEGIGAVQLEDYDYVCKLDGDLGLPERYFELLMEHMEANPLMGNMSGKTYIPTESGKWVSERMGDENAIGASKFYRVDCFRDIGGFVPRASWDGIDGHTCRVKGWIAGSLDLEEIRLKHYRPQGSSQQGIWTGRKRWGRGKYFMGSSLLYVLAVSAFRMLERPYIIGGFGILWGYTGAMLTRADRYDNAEYLRFFRRYEMSSLFRGKKRTLALANEKILSYAKGVDDERLKQENTNRQCKELAS
jgi:biofilm PGA synthesis N-glycosyltransferase PgaC